MDEAEKDELIALIEADGRVEIREEGHAAGHPGLVVEQVDDATGIRQLWELHTPGDWDNLRAYLDAHDVPGERSGQ